MSPPSDFLPVNEPKSTSNTYGHVGRLVTMGEKMGDGMRGKGRGSRIGEVREMSVQEMSGEKKGEERRWVGR